MHLINLRAFGRGNHLMKNLISPSAQIKIKLCLSGLFIVLALLALLMPIASTPNAVAQETQPNPTPQTEATVAPTPSATATPPCGDTP